MHDVDQQPTIRPGDQGAAVGVLHQALAERGLLPPEAHVEIAARLYGPASQGAVRTFQAKHPPLAVDDVVGPATWRALGGAPGENPTDPPPPDREWLGPFGAAVLAVADAELRRGVVELPFGANRGPEVDAYLRGLRGDGAWLVQYQRAKPSAADGFQGAPWCSRFALWCVERAAADRGVAAPTAGWGDLASPQKWAERAQREGRLLGVARGGVCIGNIILPGGHGHSVLIAGVDGDFVWTREGNSGNRVAAHRRPTSSITSFVDLEAR